MHEKLRDKGVVVVGISVDADANDYQKFLKDHNVTFITARNPGEQKANGVFAPISSEYGTYKFPETYIIDRNGIIRRKLISAQDFNQQEIQEYLTRL
jgi:peroxiredoxin